jgi:hypothetical protein
VAVSILCSSLFVDCLRRCDGWAGQWSLCNAALTRNHSKRTVSCEQAQHSAAWHRPGSAKQAASWMASSRSAILLLALGSRPRHAAKGRDWLHHLHGARRTAITHTVTLVLHNHQCSRRQHQLSQPIKQPSWLGLAHEYLRSTSFAVLCCWCRCRRRRVDPRGKNWNRLRAAIGQPRFINGVPADQKRHQPASAAAAAQ